MCQKTKVPIRYGAVGVKDTDGYSCIDSNNLTRKHSYI